MKISVIISLLNSDINVNKIVNNLEEMSTLVNNDKRYLKLSVLAHNSYEHLETIKNTCDQLGIEILESDKESISKQRAMEIIQATAEEFVILLNGGDRILEALIKLEDQDVCENELVYLNYSATNYKVNSKLLQAKAVSEEEFTYDAVIWEAINNKLIKKEMLINNAIDVAPILNDEEKIITNTQLYLSAKKVKVLANDNYLKLQGNDNEYLLHEEYDDQEYFEKMGKVFTLFNKDGNGDESNLKLKASYFTYELIYGQNKDRLKDINKQTDQNKETYMNQLVVFLENQDISQWESYLDIEAQGIVRAIRTKRLVTVANSYNQLALYDLYNKYKNKTDMQLNELRNAEQNELVKTKQALDTLASLKEKLSIFNNELSAIENVNRELRVSIKNHELTSSAKDEQIVSLEQSKDEYREKLRQAKAMYDEQEANCTNLKGKINEKKIVIQEKDIEISRLNLELEYVKAELEKHSQSTNEKQSNKEIELAEELEKLMLENKSLKKQQNSVNEPKTKVVVDEEVSQLHADNQRLQRENKILRDGYDDLAGRLKVDKKRLLSFLKINR